MSKGLIPSNSEAVMVIRNVTPNIVTFSVPFARLGKLKIGGRGTLVRLTSGTLALFSPVAITQASIAKVAELGGNLGYIVALDYEHHIFISEWAKQYPTAKLIGPEGLPEKRAKAIDIKIGKEPFAMVFTKANKHNIKISDEFDADFDYEYMDGHVNREIVFNYRPDLVLIQADLLFSLPATEQYSKTPEASRQSGGFVDRLFNGIFSIAGNGTWIKRFNWYIGAKDHQSYNDSVRVIDRWNFNTIIPCHGDVIERNSKPIFREVFAWHLNAKR